MLKTRIFRYNKKLFKNPIFYLKIYWIVLILYGEYFIFFRTLYNSQWPQLSGDIQKNDFAINHIAIIADPQLVDRNSYKHTGFRLFLEKMFTDNYVMKSFFNLKKIKKPDHYMFLGDLTDGGRELEDDEWETDLKRFHRIFHLNQYEKKRSKILYAGGNHDYGSGNTIDVASYKRFVNRISDVNYSVEVGNYVLVVIDTIGYESNNIDISSKTKSFIESVRKEYPEKSVLLFTHVPLWRPSGTYCGKLRQGRKKSINDGVGYQYSNLVGKNASEYILQTIKPEVVFSGDDHDNCEIAHLVNNKAIKEYTVGAFGWASGVPYPSVGLLSLFSSKNGNQNYSKFQPILLPNQLHTYLFYISSFVFTFILLLLSSVYEVVESRKYSGNNVLPHKISGITVQYYG
ncbi:hypothetical protein BB559_000490 [Furculomyces boomerangus]|uniref:Calcineurin-like phosphoesterase domain-containing protein n=1 Tax=Furculomyces boomerangus TaxID=61424 RepID=A0A2T9YDH9_9FUNG|nr:hypothetical protein BB559_004679 [Furculomyces boomerangus]PVU99676.1 hypothetical protein BB559_000490 [Furculomyces boomerangus]